MSEWLSKAKEQVLIYWFLGFYVLLFTTSALASCLLASLIGATWATLDMQGKWMIVLAVFVNWSTTMMAFFNKAAQRVRSGELPISTDDTQLISRATVSKTSTVETSTTQPQIKI